MKLRIGHLSTFYHTSILLMAKEDAGERLGVDISWELFGTGPAIVDAFERGKLDLAYMGLPPAVVGISRGMGIVCVAGGHVEGTVIAGEKEFIGFQEEEDIRVILGQFTGKSIGVPGRGSIHDVIMRECLERLSLKKGIEIVNFQWADEVTEAMARGAVSAAAGTPALAIAVKRYAGGKILYPPSKLWPNNPSYGILVDRKFLERERDVVEGFLVLHEEAASFIRDKPRQAAKVISDCVGFIDEEFVMETLRVSPKYCAQLTDDYILSTMELVKALRKLGYITREIPPDMIFDTSLIRKVHPPNDHYGDGISE